MAGLIFDAGALIAGERDDRRVYVALKSTLEKEVPVLVCPRPSSHRFIVMPGKSNSFASWHRAALSHSPNEGHELRGRSAG